MSIEGMTIQSFQTNDVDSNSGAGTQDNACICSVDYDSGACDGRIELNV